MILYFKEIKYNTYAISTSRKCSIYCALSVLHNPMKEDINRTLIAVTTDIKRFQIWSRYSLLDKRMHAHVKRELMKIYPFRRRRRACNTNAIAIPRFGFATRRMPAACRRAQICWTIVIRRNLLGAMYMCESLRIVSRCEWCEWFIYSANYQAFWISGTRWTKKNLLVLRIISQ